MLSLNKIINGIYAIWWREVIVFFREKPRLISALISPIIWYVVFSAGFGPSIGKINGIEYSQFLFIGILTQTILFTSIFYGAYLVWDRKIDVLKSILVSPIDRTLVFYGKVLGGTTIGFIEAFILIIFGILLNVHLDIISIIKLIPAVLISCIIFTAIGLAIGSTMRSPEAFQLLSSFILFPLYFISGALFPVNNLTGFLYTLAIINPVTYLVDTMRFLAFSTSSFNIQISLIYISVTAVVSNAVGIYLFKKMKN